MTQELVENTKNFVRQYFEEKSYDPSHDYQHVERVYTLAMELYRQESATTANINVMIVQLGALLHDVGDAKYATKEGEAVSVISKHLGELGCDRSLIEQVLYVVENVSFSKEKKRIQQGLHIDMTPELAIVQDADRLDAIGAIGIVRAFTFGGARNRPLYNPDTVYPQNQNTTNYSEATLDHFYEKLLKLKDMMKTESGRAMAQERHDFMLTFLDQFIGEVQFKRDI
ncbi:hypothetical protein MIR68_005662 [Amoeboaphelidium protococcarum]|nr:hypothetical protein MIR68_005662 [Amoeboaphelidium protococcarum]